MVRPTEAGPDDAIRLAAALILKEQQEKEQKEELREALYSLLSDDKEKPLDLLSSLIGDQEGLKPTSLLEGIFDKFPSADESPALKGSKCKPEGRPENKLDLIKTVLELFKTLLELFKPEQKKEPKCPPKEQNNGFMGGFIGGFMAGYMQAGGGYCEHQGGSGGGAGGGWFAAGGFFMGGCFGGVVQGAGSCVRPVCNTMGWPVPGIFNQNNVINGNNNVINNGTINNITINNTNNTTNNTHIHNDHSQHHNLIIPPAGGEKKPLPPPPNGEDVVVAERPVKPSPSSAA